jgi:putative oxidoreductase
MFDQLRAWSLFFGRIVVGIIFLVHGWKKFTDTGLPVTAKLFGQAGVPLPSLAAPAVATLEVVGGVAFIVGLALPVFGTLFALNMVGAIVFVHGENGFFLGDGGFEYVLLLTAASFMVAFSGGGKLAVDNVWRRKSTLAYDDNTLAHRRSPSTHRSQD